MVTLTVATVLYEGTHVLRDTLPALFEVTARSNANLVIVDNSGTDGPQRIVDEHSTGRSDITYVRRPANPGFAASANEAIAMASGEWVFLVNADVTVTDEAMATIAKHVSDKETTQPTAVSLVTDGQHTCGVSLDRIGYFSDRRVTERSPILGPSGGAAIFHRQSFLDLDGFATEFFAWGEDADLALRLWNRGIRTEGLELALHHVGGHSISALDTRRKKAFWLARNRLFVLRRNYSRAFHWTIAVPQILLMLANGIRKIPAKTATAHFRGMWVGSFGTVALVDSRPKMGVSAFFAYRRNESASRSI